MDRGESIIRRILAPLPPRVSLASGGVLVLLTLLLPIGYQSCGPETKGYELLQGKGDWPTFVGITLSDHFGPAFYGLVLLLAAWTSLFAIISLGKPALLQDRVWNRRMLVASGTISLVLISDAFLLLPLATDDYGALAGAMIVLSCLLPGKFWPKRIFWRWFGAMTLALLVLFALTALKWIRGDVPVWVMLGIGTIYALVPIGFWWAGLSGKFGSKWNDIQRGLVVFYFPAVLGNLWFFVVVWREGVWGFVPCSLGIHLMTLGYTRLAKESEQAAAQSTQSPP